MARTLVILFFLISLFAGEVLSQANLIHHGDLIDVDVVGGLEFDWRGRMNPEGFIDGLEGVADPIRALCRSAEDVAKDISKEYSRILRNPEVVVRIVDRTERPLASIDGAVANPTRLQLNRWPTLRETIVIAGGITSDASGSIEIFRPRNASCGDQSNDAEMLNISIKSFLSGDKSSQAIIRHGDIITVLRASVIYVSGGVVRPGSIASRETTTLSKVISASGGIARNGDRHKVALIRRESGLLKTRLYDLERIERKLIDDPVLHAFDVVEVPENGVNRKQFEPPEQDKPRPPAPLRIVD